MKTDETCRRLWKSQHSDHPKAYYKDFDGVLVTDGLEQYHKLERDLAGVKNSLPGSERYRRTGRCFQRVKQPKALTIA